MSRLRRFLSYTVLGVACIASLATSQPVGVSRQTDGQTVANGESPVIEGSIGVPRNPVSFETFQVSMTVEGRGLGSRASAPLEGRVATGDAELGPWLAIPVAAQASSSIACGPSSYCEIPFRFQLRPTVGRASSSVVLPWHVDVFIEGSVSSADLRIFTGNSGPSATALASLAALFGILASLVAVFVVMRLAPHNARRLLLIIAVAVAAVALVVLGEGVVIEGLPSKVAITSLIAFVALPLALVRATKRAQGEVLGVAVLAAPVLLGLTNDVGVYRVVDVVALFAAVGLLLPVGAALLVLTRIKPAQPPKDRPSGWRTVVLLAAFLLGLIWIWTLVVASGATDYDFWFVGVPSLSVALLAWGTWRWWERSAGGLLAITGILLSVFAVLGFFASRLPYMFSDNREPAAVVPSLFIIFVGGIALTVLSLRSNGPDYEVSGAD